MAVMLGGLALLWYLLFYKKVAMAPEVAPATVGGDPSVVRPTKPSPIETIYMGETVVPVEFPQREDIIIPVKQGNVNMIMPIDTIPKDSYIDASNVVNIPITNINQTGILPNDNLGNVAVGGRTAGSPYTSASLTAQGIPNDFSWVSPELRATGIDPAILHWAPTQCMRCNWIITVGVDQRAYARDATLTDKTVFVATPSGWVPYTGTPVPTSNTPIPRVADPYAGVFD
jgi:hypothetical protein